VEGAERGYRGSTQRVRGERSKGNVIKDKIRSVGGGAERGCSRVTTGQSRGSVVTGGWEVERYWAAGLGKGS